MALIESALSLDHGGDSRGWASAPRRQHSLAQASQGLLTHPRRFGGNLGEMSPVWVTSTTPKHALTWDFVLKKGCAFL
jgi:hypothetical protein